MDPQLAELPLRDIHAAAAPAWWPPAPGWWLLAVVLAVLAGWLGLRALRKLRQWRFRQALAAEVSDLKARYQASRDAHGFSVEAASLARRLVVHVGHLRQAAGLTGPAWADFLVGPDGDDRLREAARELSEQPYRPGGEVDVDAVTELLEYWVARVATEARHV